MLIQINIAKALEEEHWSPLAAVTAALKPPKARRALPLTRDGIRARTLSGRRSAVHQPTPEQRLFVVIIDEIDATAVINKDPGRRQGAAGGYRHQVPQ